ncbi:hypothetical protein BOX24_09520 [Leptospirillum ferriphilum]|uniref:Uncharacterized protein n=1 Tax=Leptospirillum ferriphilum TaxID=178606 RepID=A0A1V3STG0_9BACT|nr:hypothetical protein BOX24_09520 [Leptospirillum ferriphilum]
MELQEMMDCPVPAAYEQGVRSEGLDGFQGLWPFLGATDGDVVSSGKCFFKPFSPAQVGCFAPKRAGRRVVKKSGPPGPKKGALRFFGQRQGVPPA